MSTSFGKPTTIATIEERVRWFREFGEELTFINTLARRDEKPDIVLPNSRSTYLGW